jgi:hypothetical protein
MQALKEGRVTATTQSQVVSSSPQERSGTHRTEGWVGLEVGLGGKAKARPHRFSIPGPASSWRVTIPTELSLRLYWGKLRCTARWSGSSTRSTLFNCYSDQLVILLCYRPRSWDLKKQGFFPRTKFCSSQNAVSAAHLSVLFIRHERRIGSSAVVLCILSPLSSLFMVYFTRLFSVDCRLTDNDDLK